MDTGDKVTGDGIAFECHDLVIDEASLTGESEPMKKSVNRKPFCRSGTQVGMALSQGYTLSDVLGSVLFRHSVYC